MTLPARKPDWLRVRLPAGPEQEEFQRLKARFRGRGLHTVCEEARCPNIFECWGQGTATVMILGETCTRGCRFCSVRTGKPGGVLDHGTSPRTRRCRLRRWGSPTSCSPWSTETTSATAARSPRRERPFDASSTTAPALRVETLVGDFPREQHEDVRTVVAQEGRPDVFAHNVEVVPRLQRSIRDARCSWDRSVGASSWPPRSTAPPSPSRHSWSASAKSTHEVLDAMQLLRDADVDVLTIGQYLRPTKRHAAMSNATSSPPSSPTTSRRGHRDGLPLRRVGAARSVELPRGGGLSHGRARRAGERWVTFHLMDRYGKKKLTVLT